MRTSSSVSLSRHLAPERYTAVAVALHWLIAVFILNNLAAGYFMESFPGRWRGLAVAIHVSSGISVLVFSVLRVMWRVINPPPDFVGSIKPWERHSAHFVHLLLYIAMLFMPLIGWSIISAHPPVGSPGAAHERVLRAHLASLGRPVPPSILPQSTTYIWWTIPLPLLRPVQDIGATDGGVVPQVRLHDELVRWHSVGAELLIFLLALHVLGVLKHQVIGREPQFRRMTFRGGGGSARRVKASVP